MDNVHLIQLSGYDRPIITEEPTTTIYETY